MNQKQRFTTALDRGIPDRVPTFELEYQLETEMFGNTFDYATVSRDTLAKASAKEKDIALHRHAEHVIDLFVNKLEYDSIPINGPQYPMAWDDRLEDIRIIRGMVGDTVCLHHHGDGTYSIPDGNQMYDFAYRLADDFEGVLADAERYAQAAIRRNHILMEAGIDVFILCSDYCYNSGPFCSPKTFSQIIAPYLTEIIAGIRSDGAYAIKHTDGNIMPIVDQMVAAHPHAIHSLDPMAKVDIKVLKEQYGNQVALCGNVNCALMQTGTEEEVIESAMYCLTHGKPGGGYIYCTSNIPFAGLQPERYRLVLDVWKKHRDY